MSGFDEIKRKLNDLQKKTASLKKETVSISELLDETFLKSNTKFLSFDGLCSMATSRGFEVNAELLELAPKEAWDKFISEHSRFSCWTDMLRAAHGERVKKQLGL